MNAVSKKKTPQAAPMASPVPSRLSPVHGGLTVAGIHQLIEQIRDADHERDLRSIATPKSDILRGSATMHTKPYCGTTKWLWRALLHS
jgi:hypothetical protein